METKLKSLILFGLMVSAGIILSGEDGLSSDRAIQIAGQDWPSAVATQAIIIEVLENHLELPVVQKNTNVAQGWLEMDQGTLDITPETWWPNQKSSIDTYVTERKSVEMKEIYRDVRQGFWVPSWVAQKYRIHSIQDLNQHATKFDIDGDKKGDLWIGGTGGWYTNDVNLIKLRDYGLKLKPYSVDTWVFISLLNKAMRENQPIIFYYWEPDWIFQVYDLTLIEEPAYDSTRWKFVSGQLEKSSITCAYQTGRVYVSWSKALKSRSPEAIRFLKNFYISKSALSGIIADIEATPQNPPQNSRKVAKKWISNNPQILRNWLQGLNEK